MNEEQNKIIEEQFKTLSKSLQRAIAVSPWRNLIEEIAKANSLTPEQTEILERETLFVLYGFEPATDYIANIISELNIPINLAEKIAGEASDRIFEPIVTQKEETDNNKTGEDQANQENYMELIKKDEGKEIIKVPDISLEIPPENHPQTVPGETAHDVLPPEPTRPVNVIDEKGDLETPSTPTGQGNPVRPATKYPEGADPYREPLE
jgi:hypothetical protein